MATFKGKSQQNFSTVYYCSQFVFGLSILTVSVFTLYVLWVFADKRHPMRKAWVKMAELQQEQQRALQVEQARQRGDPELPGNNPTRGQVRTADGGNVAFPGMGTMGFEGVNRLTVDRLYAERKHIQKLTALYGILFIAWLVSFMILSFANGYISFTKDKNNYNIKVAQVCPYKENRYICWELAKTGISCGVISLLFLLNLIVAVVAMTARPVFSTTKKNGLVPPPTEPVVVQPTGLVANLSAT